MEPNANQQIMQESLTELRDNISDLVGSLSLGVDEGVKSWTNVINGKLIPRLSPDFPLTAAICGGGSAGKSTLFNSIVKDRLSPSGGRSGINRRVLVSAPGDIFRNSDFLATLFEPFGTGTKPLKDKEELTVPGHPLYVLTRMGPRNMVLMDTPDFDTGSGGAYTNREVVRQALETADILIYIFTNANYNNRDNTDFISEMLTGIGTRKCFLVYRSDASMDNQVVMSHAMIVAKNLYGVHAEKNLLGIYRTDEDNAIASGERFMELIPVRPVDLPFEEALAHLDPRTLRPELTASIFNDVLETSRAIQGRAAQSLDKLQLYRDFLRIAQAQCIQEALKHFPMDLVLSRFSSIWLASDPSYLRAMRKTGEIIGLPVKLLMSGYNWIKRKTSGNEQVEPSENFKNKVEEDLLNAVNKLHQMAVAPEILVALDSKDTITQTILEKMEKMNGANVESGTDHIYGAFKESGKVTFRVHSHRAVSSEQEVLRRRSWTSALDSILSKKEMICSFSEDIDQELEGLANDFRGRMGFTGKFRQTFSALLNVLPATVAVTYVLHTGDPVGGAGIQVKLASLFGIHDLYALIALPATTGLNKADRIQVQTMLGPIAKTWLDSKLKSLQELFEHEITGDILSTADETIRNSQIMTAKINRAMEALQREF